MRCYLPVLVRGAESEGVKLWGFGKTVYQELLQFIADPDYGDITDVNSGRDVVVTFHPADGAERFPKTTIMVKPNQSPATEDKNIAEKILNGQQDIFDIYKKVDYDTMKGALQTWLDGGSEEESNTPQVAQSAPAGVQKKDDIGDAFDDLFNDKK